MLWGGGATYNVAIVLSVVKLVPASELEEVSSGLLCLAYTIPMNDISALWPSSHIVRCSDGKTIKKQLVNAPTVTTHFRL